MRKIIILPLILCLLFSCKKRWKMYTYTDPQFSINIPSGWIIKQKEFDFMPINVRITDTSQSVIPNYNVVLIDPKNKLLKEIVIENSNNNCVKSNCLESKITSIKINSLKGYKVYQNILVDFKSVIVQQYYFERKETVYMISFYCLKDDFTEYKDLFKDIILSFDILS